MKLCEHIQPIYEQEIKNGNTVLGVTTPKNTNCNLGIHMEKNLALNYSFTDIKADRGSESPHDPPTIRYFCRQCGCIIDSPIGMAPGYGSDEFVLPNPKVWATPKNVYVEDGLYDQGMKPTILTEEQRQEIEQYWADHSDEKGKLEEELRIWKKKRREANSKSWDIDLDQSLRIKKCRKQIEELETQKNGLKARQYQTVCSEQKQLEDQITAIKAEVKEPLAKLKEEVAHADLQIARIGKKLTLADCWNEEKAD